MKMFMEEFKVLDMSELIVVNGCYSSYSSYSGYSSGSYGAVTSGGSNSSEPEHSIVPVGYVPGKGWLPGYGPTSTPTTDEKDENNNNSGNNKADEIDRTNSTYVKESLSNIGFRLLSEENTNGYAAGSERKYYQEIFESLKNNPDFNTSTREIPIEGSPSAGFGHENVTEYMISSNGNIQLRVIDVNNDGKVDYVYKY